jgi:hypothetical protein
MKNLRFWSVVLLLAATLLLLHDARQRTDVNPPSEPLSQLPAVLAMAGRAAISQSTRRRAMCWEPEIFFLAFIPRARTRRRSASSSATFPPREPGQTIHSPKHCLPGAGWVFESSNTSNLADAHGRAHRVGEYVIANGEIQSVCHLLVSGAWAQRGQRVHGEDLHGRRRDAMNRTDGALVRVITPIAPGEDASEAKKARRGSLRHAADALCCRVYPQLAPPSGCGCHLEPAAKVGPQVGRITKIGCPTFAAFWFLRLRRETSTRVPQVPFLETWEMTNSRGRCTTHLFEEAA